MANLSKAPRLKYLIGPSIILLGLGLGSGEIILWPYLTSKFGLGIIWAAVLGITAQFFMNMEIERYSLAWGESIFIGFSRYFRLAPYWFIFSTFIAWIWPGIIASSAKLFAQVFGIAHFEYLAIIFLLLIGAILTLGPRLYKTVETFQKVIVSVGIPLLFIIACLIATKSDLRALGLGLMGVGDGFIFIPKDLPLLTFLGALAYAGAGGNLNLAQSLYIKEKGYGMCAGAKGITSVLTRKSEKISLKGERFSLTDQNISNFRLWWKAVNIEHGLVFLLAGAFTIILLALIAYSTTSGSDTSQGIDFILYESKILGGILGSTLGVLFILIAAVMLFATQFTVLDSTSRIMSENFVILKTEANLSKVYYTILWLQIIAGIIVFLSGYSDPFTLVITSAVINAVAMFVHIGATYLLNRKALPHQIETSTLRKVIIFLIWLFFGLLSFYTIWSYLFK
ncbi:MAG: Nramp family divalent metal transporter [Candidatus Berkelbacteria bacterium]|nr:Nramp family divalent metal transporter [Candidatus Berkelbacteria bacterium]